MQKETGAQLEREHEDKEKQEKKRGGKGGGKVMDYEEKRRIWEEEQKAKPVVEQGVKGTVKWYSVRYRYGFISLGDDKKDIFVHQTAIENSRTQKFYLRTLDDGEQVEFNIVQGKKGPEAAAVTGPDNTEVRGSRFHLQQFFGPRNGRRSNPRNALKKGKGASSDEGHRDEESSNGKQERRVSDSKRERAPRPRKPRTLPTNEETDKIKTGDGNRKKSAKSKNGEKVEDGKSDDPKSDLIKKRKGRKRPVKPRDRRRTTDAESGAETGSEKEDGEKKPGAAGDSKQQADIVQGMNKMAIEQH